MPGQSLPSPSGHGSLKASGPLKVTRNQRLLSLIASMGGESRRMLSSREIRLVRNTACSLSAGETFEVEAERRHENLSVPVGCLPGSGEEVIPDDPGEIPVCPAGKLACLCEVFFHLLHSGEELTRDPPDPRAGHPHASPVCTGTRRRCPVVFLQAPSPPVRTGLPVRLASGAGFPGGAGSMARIAPSAPPVGRGSLLRVR